MITAALAPQVVSGDVLPAVVAPPAGGVGARVDELTGKWLRVKRSKHTRVAYLRDLHGDPREPATGWFAWCAAQGVNPLTARMADVDAWITAQRVRGTRRGLPASETTIARRVATVASWYAYLLRNSADDPRPLVRHNPALTDSRPRIDPDYSPIVGLSDEEVERLLIEAVNDCPTSAALIEVLVVSGLRVGSVTAAQVEDLGYDGGKRTLTVTGKGGKTRRLDLPDVVADAVVVMLAERGNPESGPLFVTPAGKPFFQMTVQRLIRRLAKRAGIPAADRLSPHSLRHTAITALLDDTNGDLRAAQDFAWHADPRTTRRYDRKRHNDGAQRLASRYASALRVPANR